jgi:hypothetical protein
MGLMNKRSFGWQHVPPGLARHEAAAEVAASSSERALNSRFLSIQIAQGMKSQVSSPAMPMARSLGGGGPTMLAT